MEPEPPPAKYLLLTPPCGPCSALDGVTDAGLRDCGSVESGMGMDASIDAVNGCVLDAEDAGQTWFASRREWLGPEAFTDHVFLRTDAGVRERRLSIDTRHGGVCTDVVTDRECGSGSPSLICAEPRSERILCDEVALAQDAGFHLLADLECDENAPNYCTPGSLRPYPPEFRPVTCFLSAIQGTYFCEQR